MGTVRGIARGKTKSECYSTFVKDRNEGINRYGLIVDYPIDRKDAYQRMKIDPETNEWVLKYHLSS